MRAPGGATVGLLLRVVGSALVVTVPILTGGWPESTSIAAPVGLRTAAGTAVLAPGELAVEAAPTEAPPDNSVVTVRVANTGGGPVTAITIEVDAPPGVAATVAPAIVDSLAAGVSVLATVTTRGFPETQPAQLVVRADGRSDAGSTAALTSIDLVPAATAASLTLTGNTRLTDSSPADLVAVIGNSGDASADVSVRATAGQHVVRLAPEGEDVARAAPDEPLAMTVPARQSAVVLVQVHAEEPLRRGSTALVVTATVRAPKGAPPVDVTASRDLDVALSADILPGLLGVGSVVVIPGLVAVWAVLTVLHRDRRRLGLVTPTAGSQIWENKLWLLVAAAVSLVAAMLYSVAGFADLLDTYTLSDIALLSVASGLIGAMGAGMAVWWYRRTKPAIVPTSDPLAVLRAAEREDDKVSRIVYRTPNGKLGLLVQTDRDSVVIAPPVEYTEVDMPESVGEESLSGAITAIDDEIRKKMDPEQHVRFLVDGRYIDGPQATLDSTPVSNTREPILKYVNEFENTSAAP